jgi:hypothetical protein
MARTAGNDNHTMQVHHAHQAMTITRCKCITHIRQ